jgi:DNA mismatch repair protein MSH5
MDHSNGFLSIDAATHDALQIFQVDKHASSMGIGKEKEGWVLLPV